MARAARLKVFQAPFGFYESVVAAPSQKAALEAWGAHQNLFAQGEARLATEPDAIAAALAEPGRPLARPLGGAGPFQVKPDPPSAPSDRPKSKVRTKAREPAADDRSAARPAAARARLEKAQAALDALEAKRATELRDFDARRRDLEVQIERQTAALDKRVAAARADVDRAKADLDGA